MKLGFDEFGRRFVEAVVTADRVEQTLAEVVAGPFDTEIRLAAGLVKASGRGNVRRIDVDQIADTLTFRAKLAIDLTVAVRLSGVTHNYEGRARVTLDLRPELRDDLSIFIDIPDVRDDDVAVSLQPIGRIAGLLEAVGSVNEQVRREIARFATRRKEEKRALKERTIELIPAIEAEWHRRTVGS